jgi:RES domain
VGGVSGRERVALRPPPDDLTGFPRWRLRRDRDLWRAHRRGRSPWWFCSDLRCRFDLPAPAGTCYLATDPATAVRERLGPRLVAAGMVPPAEADAFVLSKLRVDRGLHVADTTAGAAVDHGVTRELAAVVPYSLPQQWAAALHRHGHAGVRYGARFAPAPGPNAIALFGTAGLADRPTDQDPVPGRIAATAAGFSVTAVPRRAALRIVAPPT